MQLRHNEQHIEHMFQTEITAGLTSLISVATLVPKTHLNVRETTYEWDTSMTKFPESDPRAEFWHSFLSVSI